MRESALSRMCLLMVVLLTVIFSQNTVFASDEIAQIQQAIEEKGAKWTAGENWVTQLPPEERKMLYGAILDPPDPSAAKLLSIPMIDSLPTHFDWRDNNGNWITPVKNQGGCGSCSFFSAVGQVESWWKIHNANLDSMPDLSEQFILSCGDVGSCETGAWAGDILSFIQMTGVPTEACFGYKGNDTTPCSDACDDWENEAFTIPGWGFITLEEDIIDNIKSAVFRHPVSAGFTVYEDFHHYAGGVYEHVWGEVDAGHAILIVGWDDDEQCWICKNSWTPWWGENGYFRIKWSNCGMGSYMPFIWDEMTGGPAISVSPDSLDLSLTFGDSTVTNLVISNRGQDVLEYSSMDLGEIKQVRFHIDRFMAWDGFSWWCSDPELGGYGNHWLQYLDTPIIDLSNTSEPRLSWMGYWAIEDPSSAEPPYDGWDGCNVWVSGDGGKNFSVAEPTNPPYNCRSLWSFGEPDQGWNMGVGIAGWGGSIDDWTPVEFDLFPYKTDSVIIRYAFASDLAFSTIDDPQLYGFFVDDIIISDGGNVVFENHGDNFKKMRASGQSDTLIAANWIEISKGAGLLHPDDSAYVDISIKTKDLAPGFYRGRIAFTSNDSTMPVAYVPLTLDILAPDHDIAVEQVWLPGDSLIVLALMELGAKIQNWGMNDETDFDVTCTALKEGQAIYGDTVHVPLMSAGISDIILFEPFLALQTGELDFIVDVINLSNDYNEFNNSMRSTTNVTNLVDGFESETGFWAFEGGWGISDALQAYSGDFAAHVNSGINPYLNDMDATMTFIPGFDLSFVDAATLKFWTKCITEKDKDICYVEVSGDSLNWIKADSLSGAKPRWTQREVSLVDFIQAGYSRVWVRFHFVSDSVTTGFGVLIDDVEIYPEHPTDILVQEPTERVPTDWNLAQNFPNPFNMTTRIEYSLPKASDVTIAIYNIRGQMVRTLMQAHQSPGRHFVGWNGCDDFGRQVGTGIYIYRLEAQGHFSDAKKLLIMK